MYIISQSVSMADIDLMSTLFLLFGGLGIFIYGIEYMGESMKHLAGDKLKIIIEKSTRSPLRGIVVGILVTVLVQSSSATTALTIGLVRAGLMSFVQAVGIILGANIGTTVTAFIIGLDVGALALPIIFIGASLVFFFKNDRTKQLGGVILGFGMVFYGIELMGSGMSPLAKTEEATELFKTIAANPFLGLIVGALFTAVIQSSSASLGILQTLYPLGVISLAGALPIVLGSNIGTTITAVISSAGGSIESKKTTLIHVIFNVFGALLFMILLKPFYLPISIFMENILVSAGLGENPMMTIAFAHAFFNIFMVILVFFFIPYLVKFAEFVYKGEPKSDIIVELVDRNLIKQSSAISLAFVKTCIDDLIGVATRMVQDVSIYAAKEDEELFKKGKKDEDDIDHYEFLIHGYLVQLTKNELRDEESDELSRYLDVITDLERIGDHADNIYNLFKNRYKNQNFLSEEGAKDLSNLFEVLNKMVRITKEAFLTSSKEKALKVIEIEPHIDNFVRKYKKRHIIRINQGKCTSSGSFVDILSNIERIGDHCHNICQKIVIEDYYDELSIEPLELI